MSEIAAILEKTLKMIRDELELKKDVPSYWLDFFLMVAGCGEKGTTAKEAAEKTGMQQAICSRMLSILGEGVYIDPRDKVQKKGLGIYRTSYDDVNYRHRMTVRLAPKGKALLEKLEDEFR